jgi:hypothetical protein
MEPTVEQSVDHLVDSIEDFARRAKPSVREIYITQEVEAIREKWRIEDLDVLNPTYLDTLRAKKQKVFDDETRALDTAIKPQFTPLRAAIGERLAAARRIPLESERVNPDTAAQHFATARLLDHFSEDRAEKWLAAHADDLAAIEARYQASDDRRDAAFVRLVEERFGLTSETPADESSNVVPMPLRRAVRARQDARIPAALREAIAKLDAAEVKYRMARVEAFPSNDTMTAAIGSLLRVKRRRRPDDVA